MKSRCTNRSFATARRLDTLKQQKRFHPIQPIVAGRTITKSEAISFLSSFGNSLATRAFSRSRSLAMLSNSLEWSTHHSNTRCRAVSNDESSHNENRAESTKDSSTAALQFLSKVRQSLCQDILSSVALEGCNSAIPSQNVAQHDKVDDPLLAPCVVLLSISGGCDSVALLHAVMELVEPYNDDDVRRTNPLFCLGCNDDTTASATTDNNDQSSTAIVLELHVVHFDHFQRGEASDGDRQLVEHLAQSMGLPFHCYYWHDHHSAGDDDFSQEVARTWRISQLSQLLQSLLQYEKQPGVILTAHHQDDSNETLLLKLLRGVHLTNLSGMDPLTTMQVNHNNPGKQEVMFGRPLIGVKKADIVEFLQSRQYVWREDASNQSDKYLRNRVRNELLPLLADLVGGDDSLQKRMDNIVQQSQELNEDTCQRTKSILDTCASVSENYFMLPDDVDKNTIDYIHKQAIFQWANQVMQGHLLPYDQFLRLCKQLTDNPHNRQWVINVRGGWDVARNGNSLQMSFMGRIINQDASEQPVHWSWLINQNDNVLGTVQPENTLTISLPTNIFAQQDDDDDQNLSSLEFVLTKCNVDGFFFTPPWRKDHTPLKLREFLRGQKVPLHLRSMAPVILAKHGVDTQLVAVYVVAGDRKWVVDASFTLGSCSDESRTLLLRW